MEASLCFVSNIIYLLNRFHQRTRWRHFNFTGLITNLDGQMVKPGRDIFLSLRNLLLVYVFHLLETKRYWRHSSLSCFTNGNWSWAKIACKRVIGACNYCWYTLCPQYQISCLAQICLQIRAHDDRCNFVAAFRQSHIMWFFQYTEKLRHVLNMWIEYYFHMQRKLTLIYNQNLVACEQAPSEGGKRDSVSETSGSRSENPQLKRVGRGGSL